MCLGHFGVPISKSQVAVYAVCVNEGVVESERLQYRPLRQSLQITKRKALATGRPDSKVRRRKAGVCVRKVGIQGDGLPEILQHLQRTAVAPQQHRVVA